MINKFLFFVPMKSNYVFSFKVHNMYNIVLFLPNQIEDMHVRDELYKCTEIWMNRILLKKRKSSCLKNLIFRCLCTPFFVDIKQILVQVLSWNPIFVLQYTVKQNGNYYTVRQKWKLFVEFEVFQNLKTGS